MQFEKARSRGSGGQRERKKVENVVVFVRVCVCVWLRASRCLCFSLPFPFASLPLLFLFRPPTHSQKALLRWRKSREDDLERSASHFFSRTAVEEPIDGSRGQAKTKN